MSIREVTYYVAFCDCCKVDYDYGDYTAWSDRSGAIEMADLDEINGLDYCEDCWEWSEDEDRRAPKGCKHPEPTEQERRRSLFADGAESVPIVTSQQSNGAQDYSQAYEDGSAAYPSAR